MTEPRKPTPLSGRQPGPTPVAGSLPAVQVPSTRHPLQGLGTPVERSYPRPPPLPDTDPPPRASKARELYLKHHATPSPDAAFEVLGVVLDELDEVHEETAHVSQRQTAIEQQMSEGFRVIRGGLSNIADDLLKTAEKVREQGLATEEMETRLMRDLGKMSRQDSSHDLADAHLEARLVAAEQELATEKRARLDAEKQKATAVVVASTAQQAQVVAEVDADKARTKERRAKYAAGAATLGALLVEGILWLLRHS